MRALRLAEMIRKQIAAVMWAVSTSTFHRPCQSRRRFTSAMIRAPAAPTAPASTGVNRPP